MYSYLFNDICMLILLTLSKMYSFYKLNVRLKINLHPGSCDLNSYQLLLYFLELDLAKTYHDHTSAQKVQTNPTGIRNKTFLFYSEIIKKIISQLILLRFGYSLTCKARICSIRTTTSFI